MFALRHASYNFLSLIVILLLSCETSNIVYGSFNDWRMIETLAEKHPYIVALLNETKLYVCTGVIINHRVVLTSGHCVFPEPTYVAVGCALLGNMTTSKNVFEIAFTRAHEDYMYEVSDVNHNITRMHSNIAIVFTVKPVLLYVIESAVLGNYFESELRNKILYISGYGKVTDSDVSVLQLQEYKQVACTNPKWYYCICGKEYDNDNDFSYDLPFGEGSPVFYGDEVVGIAACPTGTLTLKSDVDYNIFTVITPYKTWIAKTQTEINQFNTKAIRSKSESKNLNSSYTIILVLSIKLFIR